jgi:hypothetical protein
MLLVYEKRDLSCDADADLNMLFNGVKEDNDDTVDVKTGEKKVLSLSSSDSDEAGSNSSDSAPESLSPDDSSDQESNTCCVCSEILSFAVSCDQCKTPAHMKCLRTFLLIARNAAIELDFDVSSSGSEPLIPPGSSFVRRDRLCMRCYESHPPPSVQWPCIGCDRNVTEDTCLQCRVCFRYLCGMCGGGAFPEFYDAGKDLKFACNRCRSRKSQSIVDKSGYLLECGKKDCAVCGWHVPAGVLCERCEKWSHYVCLGVPDNTRNIRRCRKCEGVPQEGTTIYGSFNSGLLCFMVATMALFQAVANVAELSADVPMLGPAMSYYQEKRQALPRGKLEEYFSLFQEGINTGQLPAWVPNPDGVGEVADARSKLNLKNKFPSRTQHCVAEWNEAIFSHVPADNPLKACLRFVRAQTNNRQCGCVSEMASAEIILQLAFPDAWGDGDISLQELVQYFGRSVPWKSDDADDVKHRCQEHPNVTSQGATINFIVDPPSHLLVQIQRTCYDESSQRDLKRHNRVTGVLDDIFLYGNDGAGAVYNCVSLVNHIGSSPSSGHYTSVVIDPNTGVCYHVDDEKSTIIRPILDERNATFLLLKRKSTFNFDTLLDSRYPMVSKSMKDFMERRE